MKMVLDDLEFLVVGSGFFGAVVAEQIASVLEKKVLVIEKRDHIGGNSYSVVDKETGIEQHIYGTHIFHTTNKSVWNYITRFDDFTNYQHRVQTEYKSFVYSMPISLTTINAFYKINLRPYEVDAFIKKEISKENILNPSNLEEMAISLIGRPLYNAFIKGYTKKQWEKDPKELPSSIITRLPIRNNYNTNYFNDPFQGLPLNGYHQLFKKILTHKNIEVKLNTNFFDIKEKIPSTCKIIYTGPIDQYFNYQYGALEWRGLSFKTETMNYPDFQGTATMNYADEEIPYTRIHEFKHLHPERKYLTNKTIIAKEFSHFCKLGEDPYYPVNTKENNTKYQQYQKETMKLPNTFIGGRLGQYCYLDMDKTISLALEMFEKIKNNTTKKGEK